MNLADLSIRRPIFITCVVLVMLAVGLLCMRNLGVDLFPDVNFPIVTVTTSYPGAGPEEIETLISKPMEDEISTISGIKRLTSVNYEGLSRVIGEFTLDTDIKFAEQQIRDRASAAKRRLPLDAKEPVIRRIDPADQPIIILSLKADLGEAQLFDVADDLVRPKLEQVNQVGLVDILGGRKREIQVVVDRAKLKERQISATTVAEKLAAAGENIPSGKINVGSKETVFRTLGEFKSIDDIQHTIVSLFGNERPTTIGDLGQVQDTLVDETSRAYYNGDKSLFLWVFRQSGANTVAVADAVKNQINKINHDMENLPGKPQVSLVMDGSNWIRANVTDVKESIFLGIALTVLVVFFFLGNARSTLITGLALPNSLIGAFILMSVTGFTINIVTLLALSLSVGLLIDDAIVVRENIFRHIEMGVEPFEAARKGTAEVRLAVVATTLTVIAVFGPVAFMKGFTGQFFRQFGLTICFAMVISLFDALTIAPMLSAYMAGRTESEKRSRLWELTLGLPLRLFNRFQDWLDATYEKVLRFTVRHSLLVLFISFAVAAGSIVALRWIPKTFFPPHDAGEFSVLLEMPPGTNLEAMTKTALEADSIIRANKVVKVAALTVGGRNGEANVAEFYINLAHGKERNVTTSEMKEILRDQLKPLAYANPKVQDYDPSGGQQLPFNLNLISNDQKSLEEYADKVLAKLRQHPGLKQVDSNFRPGKPEFQISLDSEKARQVGVSTRKFGAELRTQVEGTVAAKFREAGREYDIRVRASEAQRNLKENYAQLYVPNINDRLIPVSAIAKSTNAIGPATINRQDRGRFIQITADIAEGAGLGDIMNDVVTMFKGELKPPTGLRYAFVGDSENFEEFGRSMGLALFFAVLFIFMVLSSLYESFITPLTIMLSLPLAICGALYALCATRESVNLFSMIGVIMLLGVASKNSILLVDLANQLLQGGMDRTAAIIKAGTTRLRPILMTTMALIAGTVPVALGLNEASRNRTSMGIAIIGGLISSTVLTLVVVPAAYAYIDRFRLWCLRMVRRLFGRKGVEALLFLLALTPLALGPSGCHVPSGVVSRQGGNISYGPENAQEGIASWYGEPFHGRRTASGEVFDMNQLTAAHRTAPLGTYAWVVNNANQKRVRVRINDRGPFVDDRIIDLSRAAAQSLEIDRLGTAKVLVIFEKPDGAPQPLLPLNYFVQIGSFAQQQNAETALDELRDNFTQRTFFMHERPDKRFGTLYKLRCGPFTSRSAAANAASDLAATAYFKSHDLDTLVITETVHRAGSSR